MRQIFSMHKLLQARMDRPTKNFEAIIFDAKMFSHDNDQEGTCIYSGTYLLCVVWIVYDWIIFDVYIIIY